MYKKFFVSPSLCALFFLTLACAGNNDQLKISLPDGPGGNKPPNTDQSITAVAPRYAATQIKSGNWLEWTRTSGAQRECRRLSFSNVTGALIEMEIRSTDCITVDDSLVDIYYFKPTTGKVEVQRSCVFGKCAQLAEPKIKSIHQWIYGSDEKVNHVLFNHDSVNNKGNYPAFYLNKEINRFYLNMPGHAFHAFALRWIETTDTGTWTVDVSKSDPAIPISNP
jgi:hypothetical protein